MLIINPTFDSDVVDVFCQALVGGFLLGWGLWGETPRPPNGVHPSMNRGELGQSLLMEILRYPLSPRYSAAGAPRNDD